MGEKTYASETSEERAGDPGLLDAVVGAIEAGQSDRPSVAHTVPMTRGWLAALSDARHILKALAGQGADSEILIEHTRSKLAEIHQVLAQVARWGEGAGQPEEAGSFDLVVEAVCSWDNGGSEDFPANEHSRRTFVALEAIDDALLRRLEGLQQLLQREGLEEVVVARPARWGSPVGLDARSQLIAMRDGLVRARVELDDGLFESVPVLLTSIRSAWLQGAVEPAEAEPALRYVRWGNAVYASWATSGMARLIHLASRGGDVARIESELAAEGYRMAASLMSLDSEDEGDAIETLDGELVDDEAALSQRVRDLACEWTQLIRARTADAAEFERVQQAIVRARPRG
jgi:hypothetical protein